MRKAGLDESTVLRGCSGALKDTSAGGFGVDAKQAMPVGRPLTVQISAAALGCVARQVQDCCDSFTDGHRNFVVFPRPFEWPRELEAAFNSLAAPDPVLQACREGPQAFEERLQ